MQRCCAMTAALMDIGQSGVKASTSFGDVWSAGVLLCQLAIGRLPFLSFVNAAVPRSKRQYIALCKSLFHHLLAWKVRT